MSSRVLQHILKEYSLPYMEKPHCLSSVRIVTFSFFLSFYVKLFHSLSPVCNFSICFVYFRPEISCQANVLNSLGPLRTVSEIGFLCLCAWRLYLEMLLLCFKEPVSVDASNNRIDIEVMPKTVKIVSDKIIMSWRCNRVQNISFTYSYTSVLK